MLDKLLNNIHPGINKDPQSSPALNITGSGTVIIDKDIMQISGGSSAQYDLKGYTLGSLMSAINSVSGLSATCYAPTNLSALVLIKGTYAMNTTISMFNSFLWQLMKPVAVELLKALGAEGQAILEMVMTTSEGAWLDSFGELFNVVRESGEPDSMYATRIFNLSVGVRVNNIAIQKVLSDVQYQNTAIQDSGSASFTVNTTIPTDTPQGFVYSTAQIRNIIDQIRPAGVSYQILSQGSVSDSATTSDSLSFITKTTTVKYGVRKWGQSVWG